MYVTFTIPLVDVSTTTSSVLKAPIAFVSGSSIPCSVVEILTVDVAASGKTIYPAVAASLIPFGKFATSTFK